MIITKRQQAYKFGVLMELYVVFYMFLHGYVLLAHRYKTKVGEIDLIFRSFKTLLAVEVKGRKNKKTSLEETFREKQILRIKKALNLFLSRNEKYQNFNIRIDFILVKGIFNFECIRNIII